MQETYDLTSNLPNFIGCFLDRQKKGLENTWIIKPVSMARSIDTWVTNNVEQICRLVETGPKIAQKYIERPICFQNRKIDMRYVVILKSLFPLQLYVCNEFYIRFTNKQFSMAESTFHEYDSHFTVNNYAKGESGAWINMQCWPFVEQFDKDNEATGLKFDDIN